MTSSTTGEIVVGKGKLTLTDAVKRELYNEETTIDSNDKDNDNDGEHASKKVKLSNDTTIKNEKKKDELDECWVKVGRLGFYLETPRSDASPKFENDTIQELSPHSGKMLSLELQDDSYNPSQIRVKIPGRTFDNIWKYGGDVFLTKFILWSNQRTKIMASLPSTIEVLDDPKRKTWALIPIDIHFYLHKDINLLEHPGMNVKRQVKQLIHYMRGGSQPNPAKYEWPIVREEIVNECERNANIMDRLMKKKTAKDWWK